MSGAETIVSEVDLTNCDREPIHQLGAIQPIGFMLVLTADWQISNVSANIGEFLDVDRHDLIGRSAADILSKQAIHALRNRLALLRGRDAMERVFRMVLQDGEAASTSPCICRALGSSSKANRVPNMIMATRRAQSAAWSAGSSRLRTCRPSSTKAPDRCAR